MVVCHLKGEAMRFGIMAAAGVLAAATAGMAHGERESGKSWSIHNYLPNVPPQDVPMVIAQAKQASVAEVRSRAVGICLPVSNNESMSGDVFDPIAEAARYLRRYEHKKIIGSTEPGTVVVLEQPIHGVLRPLSESDRGKYFDVLSAPLDALHPAYVYVPDKNFFGHDKMVVAVEVAGAKVKVVYYIRVVEGRGDVQEHCDERGYFWRISTATVGNEPRFPV